MELGVIAILDYKAGNLTSVERALKHLGFACSVTNSHEEIRKAERIVFPGVGAAGKSMESLKELGLDALLRERFEAHVPILGICVGLQVLFDFSHENDTPCLGLLPGEVRRFPDGKRDAGGNFLKIPHMGWNVVEFCGDHPVFRNIPAESEFYFVHSYYPEPAEKHQCVGRTDYGLPFCSAVASRSLAAVQFHPEKSGKPGLQILENFCKWDGIFDGGRKC
ncbi:MAG: imidazole glycerol phosphate synthase subunit HisH [Desulfobacteraceae bacterium]|nr:imidazole glycerol phosphate synthase subunit HisH [Desulfobacteraceae bacterium]